MLITIRSMTIINIIDTRNSLTNTLVKLLKENLDKIDHLSANELMNLI